MTAEPKPLTKVWMNMLPTEMKLCCRMLGTATTTILRSIMPEKRATLPSVGICRSRSTSTSKDSRLEAPWAMKVAQATPATPALKPMTNHRSRMMLPTEEKIRKISGVRESPMALKMPVHILYKNKKVTPPM